MLIDLSAAFDCVDHQLLLRKMEVLGFDCKSVGWCRDYLKDRYQCVYIDGGQSSFHRVGVGVPQGSIHVPLFYILFTNDLPEIIHEESCPLNNCMVGISNTMCPECGGLVAFADDSTVTVSDISPARLTEKLSVKFEKNIGVFCQK